MLLFFVNAAKYFTFHLGLQKKAEHYYISCIFLFKQVRVTQVYSWIYETHMLKKYTYKHYIKSWRSSFAELKIPLHILKVSFKIVTEMVNKDGTRWKFRFKKLNTEKRFYKISIKTIIKITFMKMKNNLEK